MNLIGKGIYIYIYHMVRHLTIIYYIVTYVSQVNNYDGYPRFVVAMYVYTYVYNYM